MTTDVHGLSAYWSPGCQVLAVVNDQSGPCQQMLESAVTHLSVSVLKNVGEHDKGRGETAGVWDHGLGWGWGCC